MLTEAEAKKKRCPLPMGAMHDERTQGHCIASDCMLWRWSAWRCGKGCGTIKVGHVLAEWVEPCRPPEPKQQQYYDRIGFCGAGGNVAPAITNPR